MQDVLSKAGVAPNTSVMDNEISHEFTFGLVANNVTFQLLHPYTNRRNLVQRTIQKFENHFKAGLASDDTNFPLSGLDRLIEQANIT